MNINQHLQHLQTLPQEITYLSQFGKIPARYIGLVGKGNLGDEILGQVICAHFANSLRLYSPMTMSKVMAYVEKQMPYKAHFLGGGTLIKSVSEHLRRLERLHIQYPTSKFIVFGTGVGDTTMWEDFGVKTNIEPWKRVLNQSQYISVRGPLSKQFLESWGIKKPIKVIGDPAILLARESIKPKQLDHSIGLNLGSLLTRKGRFHGGDQESVHSFYIKLLTYLKANNFKITFFPMHVTEVEQIKLIARASRLNSFHICPAYKQPIEKTLKQLENQDIFIGERLHSAIFASCTYTPTIMLEYRTKCLDFMTSINCQQWNIRTDKLDLDLIVDQIRYFYTAIISHQEFLFSEMQAKVESLEKARQDVLAIVT